MSHLAVTTPSLGSQATTLNCTPRDMNVSPNDKWCWPAVEPAEEPGGAYDEDDEEEDERADEDEEEAGGDLATAAYQQHRRRYNQSVTATLSLAWRV